MALSRKQQLVNFYQRIIFSSKIVDFNEVLEFALTSMGFFSPGNDLDRYILKNTTRHWNELVKEIDFCKKESIIPVFSILDDETKKLSWNFHPNYSNNIQTSNNYYYPLLMKQLDEINDRKYEAFACCLCENLNAENIYLTPKGNEAGIDFIATFNFGSKAHFLFGVNGPIRVIGQVKKYTSTVQVNEIKEFNTTLNDVYARTEKIRQVVPSWFNDSKGPIISWFINHSGFQSGAISRARDYGIILSDSKNIAQQYIKSSKLKKGLNDREFNKFLQGHIDKYLEAI